MRKILLSCCLFLLFFILNNGIHAQVSINADGTDPDGSAMLDVKSTNKGVLIPRMTATERDAIANPATGLMVFVSNELSFYYYDGTAWVSLSDVFEHSDTTVRMNISPENVDFVFGSPQLNDDGNTAHDSRFFFNKSLGAFRAGETDEIQWDEENTGELSTAFGKNNVASGKFSFALGQRSTASGMLSFAAGKDVLASGDFSFAMGDQAAATNFGSVAVGYLAEASGLGAVSLGWATKSPSALETTLGYYPTEYTPNNTFAVHPLDRLFTIGNGNGISERSDALVILKNGNTGIGSSNPAEKLHVEGSIRMVDGNQQAGYVMTSDADGTASWQSFSGSDDQTLSLNGSTLSIEDGNSVDLSPINTDDQAISLNSNTLSLEDGGSVDLSAYLDNTDNQDLSLSGNTLNLSGDVTPVDLSGYLDNTDDQAISLNSNTLSLEDGGSVDLSAYLDNTDNQDLSLTGNTLSLTGDASDVNLSAYLDNTDDQAISLNSNTLSLEDGGSVDLSAYLDNTDSQDLSLTGNTLSLTGDASDVDLSAYLDNTDDQAISLNSNTLSLEDGGSVDLSAFANENTRIVQDADYDTKMQVEESADEDVIRFDVAGGEVFTIGKNANGVAVLQPKNSSNTILGENAGNNAGSIDYNTYIGYQAGNGNANYGNTFIGAEAGLSSEGYQNIFIGEGAGGTSTGNGNIFIGYEIGFGESGSNKLMIENEDYISPLIYGEFDNDLLRINGTLNVNNAYSFPTADGTNGQVVTTNGSGLLSWTTLADNDNQMLSLSTNTLSLTNGGSVDLSGYLDNTDNQDLSLSGNTLSLTNDGTTVDLTAFANDNTTIVQDADNDTKIQVEESADEDIIRFDLAGTERWRMSGKRLESITGNQLFIGQDAGGINGSGDFHLSIGFEAGYSNTSGYDNLNIGFRAGYNTASGNFNAFIGPLAGYNNSSGSANLFIGSETGRSNTTGSRNIFLGRTSGYKNTIGQENIFIGTDAGYNNVSGSSNIFIGTDAGKNETGSEKLYIANTNTSSPLIYGEFDNSLLRVNGTLNINNAFSFPTANGTNGQILAHNGSGALVWTTRSLSLNANTLSLDNGSSVDLSSYLDNTDNQDLSLSGHTLSLTNDGTTVNLSAFANENTNIVQDADNDTKIQVEESPDDDVIRFDIAGNQSLTLNRNTNGVVRLNTSGSNTLLGGSTGAGLSSGTNNSFFGQYAGLVMTTGSNNTLFGYRAGNIGTGSGNTIIGSTAGQNATGSDNVFIGKEAGYNETGSNKLFIDNSSTSTPLIYGEFDNDLLVINGQLSMQHNIAWGETTGAQSKQDEIVGATYQNITTTSSLDVRTGDILKIEGWVSMKMNEGSGTDLFNIRVSASGCSNFNTNLLDNIGPPRDSGDRQDYRQYSYGDVHVAPCDGTYTFTLQINNTGDDDWTVKDALLIVTKY